MPAEFMQFKSDVEAKLAEMSQPSPSKFAAPSIDWAKIKGGIAAFDAVIQNALPVANTLLPAQYKLIVDALAAALHAAVVTPIVPAA
jgi:hypothetical protein